MLTAIVGLALVFDQPSNLSDYWNFQFSINKYTDLLSLSNNYPANLFDD